MTREEANKVIAEYMGKGIYNTRVVDYVHRSSNGEVSDLGRHFPLYSSTLDTLIPVWVKLQAVPSFCNEFDDLKLPWACILEMEESFSDSLYRATIQEAAAIATARAIQKIKISS